MEQEIEEVVEEVEEKEKPSYPRLRKWTRRAGLGSAIFLAGVALGGASGAAYGSYRTMSFLYTNASWVSDRLIETGVRVKAFDEDPGGLAWQIQKSGLSATNWEEVSELYKKGPISTTKKPSKKKRG